MPSPACLLAPVASHASYEARQKMAEAAKKRHMGFMSVPRAPVLAENATTDGVRSSAFPVRHDIWSRVGTGCWLRGY